MRVRQDVSFVVVDAGSHYVALPHDKLTSRLRDRDGDGWVELPVIHSRSDESVVALLTFRRRDIIRFGQATVRAGDEDELMDEAVAMAAAVLTNPEWFA